MALYTIKFVGFEDITADSPEAALKQFDAFLDKGYKLSDLRWKSFEILANDTKMRVGGICLECKEHFENDQALRDEEFRQSIEE